MLQTGPHRSHTARTAKHQHSSKSGFGLLYPVEELSEHAHARDRAFELETMAQAIEVINTDSCDLVDGDALFATHPVQRISRSYREQAALGVIDRLLDTIVQNRAGSRYGRILIADHHFQRIAGAVGSKTFSINSA